MKGDLKLNSIQTSVSVAAAAKSTHKKTLTKLSEKAEVGSKMVHNVAGEDVVFELVKIEANFVENATMAFLSNERDQELLDELAVADLLETFGESGQQVPAFGRRLHGILEVADGSRRRMAAIIAKKPFYSWVANLNDKQMQYLSDIGNVYRSTSAYEKGTRWLRLLKTGETQEKVAELAGMTRKAMMRYVDTAKLPKPFIAAFNTPNELTARKGEALYRLFKQLDEKQQAEVTVWCEEELKPNKAMNITEKLVVMFAERCESYRDKKETAITKREIAMGATVQVKNGNATIKMPKVSEESLKAIEEFISRTLSEEAIKNC